MFGCCLTSMHATNPPFAAAGCSDASKAVAVTGPVYVWQCLSASCHMITAQLGVFMQTSSHVAAVADSSPNGAVVWSTCLSLATVGPVSSTL
jgi:hypothetical protein